MKVARAKASSPLLYPRRFHAVIQPARRAPDRTDHDATDIIRQSRNQDIDLLDSNTMYLVRYNACHAEASGGKQANATGLTMIAPACRPETGAGLDSIVTRMS